jgi:aspartyl protease family protein
MLRNILIFTVFAIASASLSVAYRSNPSLFEDAVKSAVESRPALTAATPPANPPPAQPLGRKVIVQSDALGHFSASFRLNGRQIDAMVDTGATLVAINASTARRIGISLNQSDFRHEVGTANGTTKAALVNVDSLQIGRIALEDVQAVVLDDKALQTNLIGMSFLGRLGKFQAENGKLLLVQ